MNSSFISGENPSPAYPFVKVEYFKRPLEQQNVVAKIIFECLKEIGYPESDVYFSFSVLFSQQLMLFFIRL